MALTRRGRGEAIPHRRVLDLELDYVSRKVTRQGTENVARFSLELARKRRGKLTVSAKTNMLPKTDRYFCEIVAEVAQDYPDVEFEQFIIDDMAHRLVLRPHGLDVVLLFTVPGVSADVEP